VGIKQKAIDRIGRRSWSESEIDKYVGEFSSCWLTYAADASLRVNSSSGGSTTAILLHLLDTGAIDGAMVVRGWVDDAGRLRTAFEIATDRQSLLAAQGSKYQAVRFGQRELSLIADFPGRLGFVLLPCDATKLAHVRRQRPDIDERVGFVLALFCGHNTEPELAQGVAEKLGPKGSRLTGFHYRSGHWRGVLTADYADGTRVEARHNEFQNLHNLYFMAQPKCNHCFDHFGYDSDMSVGDVWTLAMKQHPIKHTAAICRSERSREVLEEAISAGTLVGAETDVRDILDGQSRTLPFHYNVSARAKIGPLFGLHIRDHVQEPVRIRDLVVAFIILLNQRVSRTRLGRALILRAPRPVVRAYLVGLKALEQL